MKLKFKSIIVIIMFSLICSSVYSYDYYTKVNESELLEDNYSFVLQSSTDNNTIFLSLWKDENFSISSTDLNFGDFSYYFNNTNISYNISINLSFSNVGDNNISYFLKINDSNSNKTLNKSFFIEVIQKEIPNSVWINSDVGEYERTTCNTRLPVNFSKTLSVGGNSGSNVTINSSVNWLKVPHNVSINSKNYAIVTVEGIIENLSLGSHQGYVFFTNDNITDNVSFKINIEDCGILNECDDYFNECDEKYSNKSSSEYKVCIWKAQNMCSYNWLNEFSERNKTIIEYKEVNVTREIPVEVVKVDNKTVDSIVAEAAAKALQDIYDEVDKKKDKSIEEKDEEIEKLKKVRDNYTSKMENYDEDVNRTSNEIIKRIVEENDRKSFIFNFFIFICICVGLGFGGYLLYQKYEGWY